MIVKLTQKLDQFSRRGAKQSKIISKIYLLTFLLPLTSIIWRVLYRGYHYAGWEIIFAAEGLFLIKDFGFVEAINKIFYFTRHCQYCGGDGIILNFIPGLILSLFPWEFWPHLLTFLIFIFSFWLCGISFQLKDKQWAWLALALGSSATLLSHSICGGQYVSGMLPHSLALLIIFHPYFKKNWCCGLLLGFLTIEISWHVYPLGKTIFILFFLAAFLQDNAAIKNRVVHFVLGAVSAFLIYSKNVGMVSEQMQSLDNLIAISWENFVNILKVIFWEPGMDLLTIPVLGLICLLFLRKNRLLFAGILLSQWLLVLLAGFHGLDLLRPRRFVLVDFYSIVVLLVIVKQWWPDIQKRYVKFCIYTLTIILFCGNILQFMNLTEFTSIDIHEQKYSLPYTFSSADYFIRPQYEDAADAIANHVKQGKKIILVYNYNTYQENRTNPEALPERLCLKLGYKKFKENIIIFMTKRRGYFASTPTIPLSEIDTTLNKIKNFNNYLVFRHPAKISMQFKKEEPIIMKAIEDKFTLEEQEKVPPFIVYKILPPGNQVTLKAKDTSSMELPEDFYSGADGAPFLIETASDANTVAWLRFVDAQETFYGHPYHWLSRGVLSLIIDIKPQKGQALELLWGAKNDQRTATLVVNGKQLALKAGEYSGFRWLRIPLPEFPTAKQYKITIKPDQTPVAFIAEVRLTATKADLGRPDFKIPAYKVSSSAH